MHRPLACTLLVLATALAACVPRTALPPAQPAAVPAPPPAPPPPPVRIQIVATGDFLMHLPLVTQSQVPDTGRHDFLPLLADVLPYIREADLAIGQLETTLAGADRGWAGFPLFNSPPDLARSIKEAGYHAVTLANNHILDFGEPGLMATIATVEQAGLYHTGAFRSPAERDRPLLIPVKGLQVALLAYTQHTNGFPRPRPYLVNIIADGNMPDDIWRARAAGADLVIVALHAGEEDQHKPAEYQRAWVREAVTAGADIILGCHPHVLQPIEVMEVPLHGGGTRRAAVIYSMANFVGVQYGLANNTGVIFRVEAVKDPATGRTALTDISYIPTWIHRRWTARGSFSRVVAIEKALHDYEHRTDPHLGPDAYALLKQAWKESNAILKGSPEVRLHSVVSPPPGPVATPGVK